MIRLIPILLLALTGCAVRQPGGEYRGVTSYETRSFDGVTESYIGIGVKL